MKRHLLALCAFCLLFSPSFAQKSSGSLGAELVYVDGNEFTVTYADGTVFDYRKGGVIEGDLIPVGAVIKTGAKTLAELRLKPNKSIVKLSRNTNFKVEGLASTSSGKTNSLALASGKVRVIAARLSGEEQFKIKGQTAVCGVRGTDFVFSAGSGANDRLTVKKGLVDLWRLVSQGEDLSSTVSVASGQYADAVPQGLFSVMTAGADIVSDAFGDMDFIRAKESEVPGHEDSQTESAQASPSPEPSASPGPEASPAPEQVAVAPSESPSSQGGSASVPSDTGNAEIPQPDQGGEKAAGGPAGQNPFMKWLSEFMNAEIGAITINDETYAKAVLQPVISVGKFKTALYLPIIYRDNIFDPEDWYHPQGNDEWSFGTDKGWTTDTLGAFADAAKDLALKVKFLEYGDQQFDPFFIKVGNLSTFTLGHGMLMKNYANDSEFPAVRRVGFDIGFNTANTKPLGLEFLTNDLADPEIFGARVLLRPFKNGSFGIGLSSVMDISPASMLNTDENPGVSAGYGDPMLAGMGLDLDIPILNTEFLALKAFADAGVAVPIILDDYSIGGNEIEKGFKLKEALWNSETDRAQNWGAMAGALGSIGSLFDWRLEYRYSTGSFRHNMFDKNYDANRGRIASGYSESLANPAATDQPDLMGIYGEGGFSFLKDKLVFSLGYFWPWVAEYGFDIERQMGVMSNDKFHAQLDVKRGLIPVIDLSGSIIYDRTGFVSALDSGESSGNLWALLFDENTSFRGELLMPLPKAPNLDIALLFALAPERDERGDIVFADDAGLRPNMVPVLSIETRLHF